MNYLFVCMKRGGQHGIINWFAQQNNHCSMHYNHCIKGWKEKRFLPMKEHMVVYYNFIDGRHDIKNYFVDHKMDFASSQKLRDEFYKADFSNVIDKIYNVEDLSIKEYNEKEMWNFNEMRENSRNILILRDPYNFIASCLQRLVNPPDRGAIDVGVDLPKRLKMWKEHANQILYNSMTKEKFYFINFNEWFASESYRESICKEHGLLFTDFGINRVMNFGSGSSFDRMKYNGKAQKMNVLSRFEKWKSHSAFRHLVDDEIAFFAKEIFGMVL